MKSYMLTEPCGVVLKMLVYTGAEDTAVDGKENTTKIVLELLKNYFDSGHSGYLDKFHNAFELAIALSLRNIYCTGTLNAERKNNPISVVSRKLKRGATSAQFSNNVIIGKWKDRRG
ncbi:hypothetical protein JTB14_003691 [Gonioctena quinquepunctata]|nr:hypothetical protein JTB14_003691 [Gonioctena quinquepunctata]